VRAALARVARRARAALDRRRRTSSKRRSALAERVEAVAMWWHSIDLGEGVVTPGRKPVDARAELESLQLPDLRGKTVLDIGAWDGFYAFAAERLGATRVVALDYHVWSIDRDALEADRAERRRLRLPAEAPEGRHGVWRPDTLPGKRGFDLAHEALESRVEAVVADFMTVDLDELGTFDVVLFLGVLYHLRHPLLALERVAAVTRNVAVIETEAAVVRGAEDRALCEFHAGEYKRDPTNWWVPNERALVDLCRAAGFSDVRVLTQAPRSGSYRLVAHASKRRSQPKPGLA
jgi:tRNA (mo5U34)-methyltransferase